jgi:phage N-6-adenine-methyltransferase
MARVKSKDDSGNVNWGTPLNLFKPLNKVYRFTLDAAAEHYNAKLPNYISPHMDSMNTEWYGRVFLNPPFSNVKPWMWRAIRQVEKLDRSVELVTCVIPASVGAAWWYETVVQKADHVVYLVGRPSFEKYSQDGKLLGKYKKNDAYSTPGDRSSPMYDVAIATFYNLVTSYTAERFFWWDWRRGDAYPVIVP